jgi:hypothetical protein
MDAVQRECNSQVRLVERVGKSNLCILQNMLHVALESILDGDYLSGFEGVCEGTVGDDVLWRCNAVFHERSRRGLIVVYSPQRTCPDQPLARAFPPNTAPTKMQHE